MLHREADLPLVVLRVCKASLYLPDLRGFSEILEHELTYNAPVS